MPATITGTMLTPGVSRNSRLYTRELIGKAVTRAQERIKAGRLPLTMLTHHDAADDSTRIVGHLTHVEQAEDGSARFKATLADTGHAQDIATLVRDGHLGGVSIRGAWLGELRKVDVDGAPAETADDLELDGLDFTKSPGVPDARIDPLGKGGSKETAAPTRHPVTESVPMAMITEMVEVTEVGKTTTGKAPYGDVVYADPGYQQDKQKRYPLDTKARAKAAWSYINQKDNAALYTPQQLKRIRQRIVKALKQFGVQVKEGLLIEPVVRLSESAALEMGYSDSSGSYSITLTNGPTTVTICTYCLNPAELQVIGRAAMDGACKALATLDPDMGGDIDVPGAPDADTDHDMESTTQPPSDDDDADQDDDDTDDDRDDDDDAEPDDKPTTKSKESTVADKTTAESSATQAPTAAGITLTQEQFAALLDRVGGAKTTTQERTEQTTPAAAESDDERIQRLVDAKVAAALAEQATDTATTAQETEEQRIQRLVEARLTAAIQDQVARGNVPTRKGLVGRVDESGKLTPVGTAVSGELNEHGLPTEWPNKPLDKYTAEERARYLSPAVMNHVIGHRI